MEEKEKAKPKVGSITKGLIIFSSLFVLFMAFWAPSRTVFRPTHFCKRAESDASNIVAAIADIYFVPDYGDRAPTRSEIEDLVHVDNPWMLTRCGGDFLVHVVDRSGKCPAEYQNKYPEWNSNIYTRKF